MLVLEEEVLLAQKFVDALVHLTPFEVRPADVVAGAQGQEHINQVCPPGAPQRRSDDNLEAHRLPPFAALHRCLYLKHITPGRKGRISQLQPVALACYEDWYGVDSLQLIAISRMAGIGVVECRKDEREEVLVERQDDAPGARYESLAARDAQPHQLRHEWGIGQPQAVGLQGVESVLRTEKQCSVAHSQGGPFHEGPVLHALSLAERARFPRLHVQLAQATQGSHPQSSVGILRHALHTVVGQSVGPAVVAQFVLSLVIAEESVLRTHPDAPLAVA